MMVAEELDLPDGQGRDRARRRAAGAADEPADRRLQLDAQHVHSRCAPPPPIARQRLVDTAATHWGVAAGKVTTRRRRAERSGGRTATYGSLAKPAATARTDHGLRRAQVHRPSSASSARRGTASTPATSSPGASSSRMDLNVPGAKPTMVRPAADDQRHGAVGRQPRRRARACRASPMSPASPTVSRSAARRSASASTRCARSTSTWGPGTVDGESDATVLHQARAAAAADGRAAARCDEDVDAEFTFAFASNSPLEPDNAIADVRAGPRRDLVEPEGADRRAAGHRQPARPAGGRGQGARDHRRRLVRPAPVPRRGRRGRGDLAEDGQAGQAVVVPHRQLPAGPHASDVRSPASAPPTWLGNVLTYEQRHTSVETDFGHGLGEMITSTAAELPVGGNLTFAETIFALTQSVAVQLRRHHPAAQRDPAEVQHRQHAQHLLAERGVRARSCGRPAGREDGQGPGGVPPRRS